MKVKVKVLNDKCKPYRAHDWDSGLDLRANVDDVITLKQFEPVLVGSGIAIELPRGYEGQIRPRSSFNKRGVLSSFGTIDCDYRGEIGIVLTNLTSNEVKIYPGDRIAQLVVAPVVVPVVEYVDELSSTERGSGGFGSSGIS